MDFLSIHLKAVNAEPHNDDQASYDGNLDLGEDHLGQCESQFRIVFAKHGDEDNETTENPENHTQNVNELLHSLSFGWFVFSLLPYNLLYYT